MTRQGQRQFIRWNTPAIVRHTDQRLTTISNHDLNPTRSRIDRVLDQFFDGRGWAFDHLTRRDPINRGIVQLSNMRTGFGYIGVR